MKEKIFTMGVDVGGSYVKGILMSYSNGKVGQDGLNTIIDKKTEKIRKRNPVEVATGLVNALLDSNGLKFQDIAYLASTGEGEMVRRKTGHFYSMTTHSRGGKFFYSSANTIVDMGALYVRAIKVMSRAG